MKLGESHPRVAARIKKNGMIVRENFGNLARLIIRENFGDLGNLVLFDLGLNTTHVAAALNPRVIGVTVC
jgi:hypothetical protein